MKYLVDTNIVSELRKKERADPNVIRWARSVDVVEIGTSVIVLAEIRRGIELKRRSDPDQAAALDVWFATMRRRLGGRVVEVDEATAEEWARLNVPHPMPFIDSLIAASAKIRNLVLVTRNTADFARTGVTLLDPFSWRT